MSSVTAPGSAAAAEDNPPNIDALHIRGEYTRCPCCHYFLVISCLTEHPTFFHATCRAVPGVSAAMRRSLRHAHRKAAKSWIQVDGDAMGEGMDARLRLLSSSLRQVQ